MSTDPRTLFLSEHFRLSDFLGNHSVYSRGFANDFEFGEGHERKLENAEALCGQALEPLLSAYGPLSVSYGYISPEFSRKTVKYQDPDKPSHHRWDLGAAADVISHKWVQGLPNEPALVQLFARENTRTSPALLAHVIAEGLDIPFSRLISYSESPYLCVAVAAGEVSQGTARKAFYENRFLGRPKAKPEYISQSTDSARAKVRKHLQEVGLPVPWQGGGYPSYHGGGIRQYQHIRVSKYTMLSDWLFDLKSISQGVKNIPALQSEEVQDSFAAAGILYDFIVDRMEIPRLSVLQGYVCRTQARGEDHACWRGGTIEVTLGLPRSSEIEETYIALVGILPNGATLYVDRDLHALVIDLDVESVLTDPLWV